MTVIESKVTLKRPVAEVYTFLADCNNHEQLMPENVSGWSSTRDEARFTIQNMASLALKVESRMENREVVFVPSERAPFDVTLRWQVQPDGEYQTQARLTIEAELNMMMKMVAAKPLQKLADFQVEKLRAVLG
ncbi:Polyketide cyclase / dehydrase and lipid transport [Parapedobacter composti]|uniref:Polyketide cyclase / dehydrase and lipid transport n=1 Tax=Parapedobacter composti TaxID=623281 RepID=A0A1I1KLN2_9SPHI|nr:SRPBCC family protein [Parapedobacter composti]SFC61697.1 Polyketide cyclase / dehydrase and lipid transport [Parapedobacter composti]